MSLITLLETKDTTLKSIKAIRGSDLFSDFVDNESYESYDQEKVYKDMLSAFRNILKLQYNLIFTYYNPRTLNKFICNSQYYTLDKNLYYQHQYLHNNAAIFDEIFEQIDAITRLCTPLASGDHTFKSYLLFNEETIDILHFAAEYLCLTAEHQTIISNPKWSKEFESDSRLIHTDEEFRTDVLKKIDQTIDFYANKANFYPEKMVRDKYSSDVQYSADCSVLFQFCRVILRNTNFKDWKVYPEDWFNTDRFITINTFATKIITTLYKQVYFHMNRNKELFYLYLTEILGKKDPLLKKVKETKILDKFIEQNFTYFIYGWYVSKNWINMQRQEEDPRYTGKDFGKIIGVRV